MFLQKIAFFILPKFNKIAKNVKKTDKNYCKKY